MTITNATYSVESKDDPTPEPTAETKEFNDFDIPDSVKRVVQDRYLRNRPFLVVKTLHRPSSRTNTEVAGWTYDNSNWTSFEQPSVVDRVNTSLLTDATVIIDIINGKVVKSMYTGKTDKEVMNHFFSQYKDIVSESINLWIQKQAREIAASSTVSYKPKEETA